MSSGDGALVFSNIAQEEFIAEYSGENLSFKNLLGGNSFDEKFYERD